jgi:hypothetical protein
MWPIFANLKIENLAWTQKVCKFSIALKYMFRFSNPTNETRMIYYWRLMELKISHEKIIIAIYIYNTVSI